MNYQPVEIRFGDDEMIAEKHATGDYRLTQQPLPFTVNKGAFLTRLTLTVTEHESVDELCVHITYLDPRP